MTTVKTNNEEPSTIPCMVLAGYACASLPPLLSSRHPGTISVSSQNRNRPFVYCACTTHTATQKASDHDTIPANDPRHKYNLLAHCGSTTNRIKQNGG
ncbi:hypothetical protein SNK04_14589 [Fusarium graminearum]